MPEKTLIVIVGPTAVGKTALAIEIAKHFQTEILSSDSRQFYKEMKIGTAVPSDGELSEVTHHFIQHLSIENDYSVGDFERYALEFIEDYFSEKDILIMVGGSGLYEKAVTEGLDDFPEVDRNIRTALKQELQEKGIEVLREELRQNDPEYYAKADMRNPHRLIRALEVLRGTGQKISSFHSLSSKKRDFKVIKIGLNAEREIVYEQINQRVEKMLENGLLEEARSLHPKKHLNALQTVGYRELFEYFEGKITLESAIEEIKKNTRRFAKRQLTWYRKDEKVTWFEPGENQKVIEFLEKELSS